MKKLIILFLALILVLSSALFIGCANDEGDAKEAEKDIVLPPERKIQVSVTYSPQYATAETLINETVAIARIRVGNWIKEWSNVEGGGGRSYFEAEVLEVYKGELSRNIIFIQDGSSLVMVNDIPFSTYGEEIIAFLYEWDEPGVYFGSDSSIKVIHTPENSYVIDTYFSTAGTLGSCKDEIKNHIDNSEIKNSIIEITKDKNLNYIYTLDDFAKFIKNKTES